MEEKTLLSLSPPRQRQRQREPPTTTTTASTAAGHGAAKTLLTISLYFYNIIYLFYIYKTRCWLAVGSNLDSPSIV
jgi:hypothetical protein